MIAIPMMTVTSAPVLTRPVSHPKPAAISARIATMRRSPLLSRPRTALPKLSKLVCANAGSAVTSDVSATRLAIESARDAFRWRGVIASTRLVTWVRRASAGQPKDARFIGYLLLRRAVLAHIPPSRPRPKMAAVVQIGQASGRERGGQEG